MSAILSSSQTGKITITQYGSGNTTKTKLGNDYNLKFTLPDSATSISKASTQNWSAGTSTNIPNAFVYFTNNVNTPGTISGILIQDIDSVVESGEVDNDDLLDNSFISEDSHTLINNLSGLTITNASEKRLLRSVDVGITATYKGQTSNTIYPRLFQKYNNYENPYVEYQWESDADWINFITTSSTYTSYGWSNELVATIDSNAPSGALGYMYGSLTVEHDENNSNGIIISGSMGAFNKNLTLNVSSDCTKIGLIANNNGNRFGFVKADTSKSEVDDREATINWTALYYNDSNDLPNTAREENGKFTVHQTGGVVNISDPKLTYSWNFASLLQYKWINIKGDGNKATITLSDNTGSISTVSGLIQCTCPTSSTTIPDEAKDADLVISKYGQDIIFTIDGAKFSTGNSTSQRYEKFKCSISVANDAYSGARLTNKEYYINVYQNGSNMSESSIGVQFEIDNGAKINDNTVILSPSNTSSKLTVTFPRNYYISQSASVSGQLTISPSTINFAWNDTTENLLIGSGLTFTDSGTKTTIPKWYYLKCTKYIDEIDGTEFDLTVDNTNKETSVGLQNLTPQEVWTTSIYQEGQLGTENSTNDYVSVTNNNSDIFKFNGATSSKSYPLNNNDKSIGEVSIVSNNDYKLNSLYLNEVLNNDGVISLNTSRLNISVSYSVNIPTKKVGSLTIGPGNLITNNNIKTKTITLTQGVPSQYYLKGKYSIVSQDYGLNASLSSTSEVLAGTSVILSYTSFNDKYLILINSVNSLTFNESGSKDIVCDYKNIKENVTKNIKLKYELTYLSGITNTVNTVNNYVEKQITLGSSMNTIISQYITYSISNSSNGSVFSLSNYLLGGVNSIICDVTKASDYKETGTVANTGKVNDYTTKMRWSDFKDCINNNTTYNVSATSNITLGSTGSVSWGKCTATLTATGTDTSNSKTGILTLNAQSNTSTKNTITGTFSNNAPSNIGCTTQNAFTINSNNQWVTALCKFTSTGSYKQYNSPTESSLTQSIVIGSTTNNTNTFNIPDLTMMIFNFKVELANDISAPINTFDIKFNYKLNTSDTSDTTATLKVQIVGDINSIEGFNWLEVEDISSTKLGNADGDIDVPTSNYKSSYLLQVDAINISDLPTQYQVVGAKIPKQSYKITCRVAFISGDYIDKVFYINRNEYTVGINDLIWTPHIEKA